ncbi:MAG: archease [Candidatus Bipolaricaulota bacterium]|nr:MAG: archease [Candidatus Bipolaricaulota bacterium]
MPFEFIDHTADMALRASGASFEEALCEAARALFALMVPPEQVALREHVEIRASGTTRELLTVDWLAELLAQKDLTGCLFAEFVVALDRTSDGVYVLDGIARGEPLDRRRHDVGAEVKGVSYAGLHVRERDDGWEIQCVVDL